MRIQQESTRAASIITIRWADIVCLGVVSGLVVLPAIPWLQQSGEAVGRAFSGGGPWPILLMGGLLLAPILVPIIAVGGFRISHFRRPLVMLRYPPFWFGLPVAAVVAWCFAGVAFSGSFGRLASSRVVFEAAILLPIAVALSSLLVWLRQQYTLRREASVTTSAANEQQSHSTDRKQQLADLANDPERLIQWIEREEPISESAEDLLNFMPKAERLARLIQLHPDHTFGVIGPFGSGKTSLVNIVTRLLNHGSNPQREPEFIVRNICPWGHSGASATGAVLEAAVEAVADKADCLAVAGLPHRYAAAMRSGRPPWWLSWPLWQSTFADPTGQLSRLNAVLKAIGRPLILCIEDADRNIGSEGGNELTQLEAMLDRLRNCSHLTFVLTASRTSFDFARLCDHRVEVPDAADEAAKVIQAFRWYVLADAVHKRGVIDPYRSPEHIDQLRDMTPAMRRQLLIPRNQRPDHSLPWAELCRLLGRPRLLKHALRWTWQLWQDLRGEIDFDALLVVQAIRACSPQTLGFIRDHWPQLSGNESPFEILDSTSASGDESDEKARRLDDAWRREVEDCEGSDKKAVAYLIYHIFGRSPDLQQKIRYTPPPFIQGPKVAERYWRRIWEEYVDQSERPRDQEVLQAIRVWKQEEPPQSDEHQPDLADQLDSTEGFADVFTHLQSSRHLRHDLALSVPEVFHLATQLIENLLARHDADASIVDSPGLDSCATALSDHWRPGNMSPDERFEWLTAQVEYALKHSLRLALDLEQYWGEKYSSLNPEQKEQLKQQISASCRKSWERDVANLSRTSSVRSDHHANALFELPRVVVPDALDNWSWLMPVLSDALDQNPDLMVPQVCWLLADVRHTRSHNGGHTRHEVVRQLNKEATCQLIPQADARRNLLRNLLTAAERTEGKNWPADTRAVVEAVSQDARQWLDSGAPCALPQPSNEEL